MYFSYSIPDKHTSVESFFCIQQTNESLARASKSQVYILEFRDQREMGSFVMMTISDAASFLIQQGGRRICRLASLVGASRVPDTALTLIQIQEPNPPTHS